MDEKYFEDLFLKGRLVVGKRDLVAVDELAETVEKDCVCLGQ